MKVNLPLDQMTVAEKLSLMEMLWDDLTNRGSSIQSPAWHGEVLGERQAHLESGASTVSDWSEAKDRIRNRVRRG